MLRLVQMGLSPMKHCVDRQFYSTEGATIAVITEFQSKHHRIVATKRKSNHMLLLTIHTLSICNFEGISADQQNKRKVYILLTLA